MNKTEITEVKERPILFSTPMVKAILEGRKTVTRRVIPIQPDNDCYFEMKIDGDAVTIDYNQGDDNPRIKWRYGKPGDILWVRETWRKYYYVDPDGYTDFDKEIIEFAADDPEMVAMMDGDGCHMLDKNGNEKYIPWRPSIFMPRAACRLRLEIKSIGVERLHDITEEDAIREGIDFDPICGHWSGSEKKEKTAKVHFKSLWQSINGAESWDANPWVWVISFRKL